MLTIKHLNSNITVTPMPSNNGLFSDATIPNCKASHCCLVRSAQTTALRSLVSVPSLTKEELSLALDQQLANKENWEETFSATAEETQARKDEIRGYTDADLEVYIKEKTVFVLSEDGEATEEIESQPTPEEAHQALVKKEEDMISMISTPVLIPSDDSIEQLVIDDKEAAYAKGLVDNLIANGYLVADLDAVDDEGNEIYESWKAQFEVTEQADI